MARSKGSRRSLDSRESRRSLVSIDDSSHQAPEPATPENDRSRRSSRTAGRSPRQRDSIASASSKRDSLTSKRSSVVSTRGSKANSEARSRIRKEAALKKEREAREIAREEQAAKIARQKEKLARQKKRTSELLGRKLAKLDTSKNGDPADGDASVGLDSSVHSNNNPREQRRRRRTHLSHNILVRNMNQMAAAKSKIPEQDAVAEEHSFSDDETDFHEDDMSMSNSAMDISARGTSKKEAWQRRRERQQNGQ